MTFLFHTRQLWMKFTTSIKWQDDAPFSVTYINRFGLHSLSFAMSEAAYEYIGIIVCRVLHLTLGCIFQLHATPLLYTEVNYTSTKDIPVHPQIYLLLQPPHSSVFDTHFRIRDILQYVVTRLMSGLQAETWRTQNTKMDKWGKWELHIWWEGLRHKKKRKGKRIEDVKSDEGGSGESKPAVAWLVLLSLCVHHGKCGSGDPLLKQEQPHWWLWGFWEGFICHNYARFSHEA